MRTARWERRSPRDRRRPDRMQTITVADVLEKVAIWRERYAGARSESGPKS